MCFDVGYSYNIDRHEIPFVTLLWWESSWSSIRSLQSTCPNIDGWLVDMIDSGGGFARYHQWTSAAFTRAVQKWHLSLERSSQEQNDSMSFVSCMNLDYQNSWSSVEGLFTFNQLDLTNLPPTFPTASSDLNGEAMFKLVFERLWFVWLTVLATRFCFAESLTTTSPCSKRFCHVLFSNQ